MLLESARLGLLEIDEARIIRFPQGIPGFEQYHDYVLLQPDPELPLSYLQCVNEGYVSFIVIDPFLILPSYEFELSDSVKKELQLTDPADVSVLAIVTVLDDIRNATLNLKAPLVINSRERIGKQVILHDSPYETKHPMFARAHAGKSEAKR